MDIYAKAKIYAEQGFDKVYVTDHNRAHSIRGLPVNWEGGIEVSTAFGHIVLLGVYTRPILNTLWFLSLYQRLFPGCKIIVPHPFRFGTGLFREYKRKSLGGSYIIWFLNLVDGFEYYNYRDTSSIYKKKAELPKLCKDILMCKDLMICASDSHQLTDIYFKGTQIINDKVVVEKDKLNLFTSNIKYVDNYPQLNAWNILRVLRINLLYALRLQK